MRLARPRQPSSPAVPSATAGEGGAEPSTVTGQAEALEAAAAHKKQGEAGEQSGVGEREDDAEPEPLAIGGRRASRR